MSRRSTPFAGLLAVFTLVPNFSFSDEIKVLSANVFVAARRERSISEADRPKVTVSPDSDGYRYRKPRL